MNSRRKNSTMVLFVISLGIFLIAGISDGVLHNSVRNMKNKVSTQNKKQISIKEEIESINNDPDKGLIQARTATKELLKFTSDSSSNPSTIDQVNKINKFMSQDIYFQPTQIQQPLIGGNESDWTYYYRLSRGKYLWIWVKSNMDNNTSVKVKYNTVTNKIIGFEKVQATS